MASLKKETAPSRATLQNACFWLAMRPEDVNLDTAVTLVSVLAGKSEHEIRKRVEMIREMSR